MNVGVTALAAGHTMSKWRQFDVWSPRRHLILLRLLSPSYDNRYATPVGRWRRHTLPLRRSPSDIINDTVTHTPERRLILVWSWHHIPPLRTSYERRHTRRSVRPLFNGCRLVIVVVVVTAQTITAIAKMARHRRWLGYGLRRHCWSHWHNVFTETRYTHVIWQVTTHHSNTLAVVCCHYRFTRRNNVVVTMTQQYWHEWHWRILSLPRHAGYWSLLKTRYDGMRAGHSRRFINVIEEVSYQTRHEMNRFVTRHRCLRAATSGFILRHMLSLKHCHGEPLCWRYVRRYATSTTHGRSSRVTMMATDATHAVTKFLRRRSSVITPFQCRHTHHGYTRASLCHHSECHG